MASPNFDWISPGIFAPTLESLLFRLVLCDRLVLEDNRFQLKSVHYVGLVLGTLVTAWATWPPLSAHLDLEQIPMSSPTLAIGFTAGGLAVATLLFGLSTELPFQQPPQVITYLAKASFWIYLFHHPLVGLIHVDMRLNRDQSDRQVLADWSTRPEHLPGHIRSFYSQDLGGSATPRSQRSSRSNMVDQPEVEAKPAKPLAA